MSVSVAAPIGGAMAQLGGQSRPLLLGNGEIERFESHHDVGIFLMLDKVLDKSAPAHQCRDLVALGLIGAGMADVDADALIADLPPHENRAILKAAQDVIFAAFIDPKVKKKDLSDGSQEPTSARAPITPKKRSKAP
ncbi:GTA-gp10 family protein [Planktotalea sp.]|uniref:GTA-gp10 family protein n=1 Tax=Planktotalea sp. TaxID=2029877 RepID=UPI003D6B569C